MSEPLVPNRMLFDFEFQLRRRSDPPAIDGTLGGWTKDELLPAFSKLDGCEPFAPVWACWNETGLFIACRVEGKRRPLRCDPKVFWKSDNLRLCTDMRDARRNRYATRFCQQFFFLPTGGGRDGTEPAAGSSQIHRAREHAPTFGGQAVTAGAAKARADRGLPAETDQAVVRVASTVSPTSYMLEAHIPSRCLNGFDPIDHPRIGFYYVLEDYQLGQQYVTVGDDLNWHTDPSTWATAVLVS
jgi:hypothetical protein